MRKTVLTVAGSLLVVAGLAMLALPGPGLLVIAIGLAVLASAGVMWAARLLVRTRQRLPGHADDDASANDTERDDPGIVANAMGRLDDAMEDLDAVQQVAQEDEAAREHQHREALVTTDEDVHDGAPASQDLQARVVHRAGGDRLIR